MNSRIPFIMAAVLSCGWSLVMGQTANPLADTIWEGAMTGKIKKLVRYVNGKKEWQATGADGGTDRRLR